MHHESCDQAHSINSFFISVWLKQSMCHTHKVSDAIWRMPNYLCRFIKGLDQPGSLGSQFSEYNFRFITKATLGPPLIMWFTRWLINKFILGSLG